MYSDAIILQEIIRRVASRQGEQAVRLPSAAVDQAMAASEAQKGFTLSDEQRHAVRHLTMETGGVGVLSGLAGTGKTTVSEVYGAAFESQGRILLGLAVSNAAAKKLHEESGMPTLSVARALDQLDKSDLALTKDHVVVLDEAGMVDTQQARRLLVHCQSARKQENRGQSRLSQASCIVDPFLYRARSSDLARSNRSSQLCLDGDAESVRAVDVLALQVQADGCSDVGKGYSDPGFGAIAAM